MRKLGRRAALAATLLFLVGSAPAAADTDQYQNELFFRAASGAAAPCNPATASLLVSNLVPGAPPSFLAVPVFSSGVAWVDYFGIPIFVSQPFTVTHLPVGGYSPLYGVVWPVPSPSESPPGQYTLHALLQGNGQALGPASWPLYFVFSTVSDTAIIAPGLNSDCTPITTATASSTLRAAADNPAPRVVLGRAQAMRRASAKWFGRSPRHHATYPKARICGRTICIQPRPGAAWEPMRITRR
jgi:hypothetical protein